MIKQSITLMLKKKLNKLPMGREQILNNFKKKEQHQRNNKKFKKISNENEKYEIQLCIYFIIYT